MLHELNEQARSNLKDASMRLGKYYNNRLKYNDMKRGDTVYYHYPVKNKHTSKSNYHPWKGPYVVLEKLSECLYLIKESAKGKAFVVHHNKLKRGVCRNPPDLSCVEKEKKLVPTEMIHSENTCHTSRPRREAKKPARLGEWYY